MGFVLFVPYCGSIGVTYAPAIRHALFRHLSPWAEPNWVPGRGLTSGDAGVKASR